MINERVLINLGIICLLSGNPQRTSNKAVDGTLFQDTRLSFESKLLSLVTRHFDRLSLWRYLSLFCNAWDMSIGNWRTELEAMMIASKSFERHIRPLYLHKDNMYLVNPNQTEQMYLYYNLSPQMVIDLSKELITSRIWFLGQYEIFTNEPLGELVIEVKKRYNKEVY